MQRNMLIVGGGIGGLAAALACARGGWSVDLAEQSEVFNEFGAGIQLGPNAVRILNSWGLADALDTVAARPAQIQVRNASSAQVVARLPLGASMEASYGAPYLTIARADLQQVLLDAVRLQPTVTTHLNARVMQAVQEAQSVRVQCARDLRFDVPVLVAADGIWSKLRTQVVHDAAPRFSGLLAYRAMVEQRTLPQDLRSDVVTVWMGHDYHVVQYPVRRGEWLNVVAIVHGQMLGDLRQWDHGGSAVDLRRRLVWSAPPLRNLVHSIDSWRVWPLCERAPMQSAAQHARGRIALLGDAAHPMRPFLAQGAGMAIEDAYTLADCLVAGELREVPAALQRYANRRWRRNAQVQSQAIRNGQIFHLQGVMRFMRDAALRTLGARLLDSAWLYRGVMTD